MPTARRHTRKCIRKRSKLYNNTPLYSNAILCEKIPEAAANNETDFNTYMSCSSTSSETSSVSIAMDLYKKIVVNCKNEMFTRKIYYERIGGLNNKCISAGECICDVYISTIDRERSYISLCEYLFYNPCSNRRTYFILLRQQPLVKERELDKACNQYCCVLPCNEIYSPEINYTTIKSSAVFLSYTSDTICEY